MIAFQASIDVCWNVKCTVTLFLMKDAEERSVTSGPYQKQLGLQIRVEALPF